MSTRPWQGLTLHRNRREGPRRPWSVNVTMVKTQVEHAEKVQGGRLGELYVRHADDAVRLAYLLTGDRALAEDVVQDAFVRLAGRLVHLRDGRLPHVPPGHRGEPDELPVPPEAG